jgi:hypothetical protein
VLRKRNKLRGFAFSPLGSQKSNIASSGAGRVITRICVRAHPFEDHLSVTIFTKSEQQMNSFDFHKMMVHTALDRGDYHASITVSGAGQG